MNKLLKALFFVSTGIIILAAVLLTVVVQTFDANYYKKDIIQVVEEETGRDFKINGEINLAQSLIPTLIINNASFGNPAWASSKHMVKVDQLEVQVALLPLLTRHVSVNKIILNSPEIYLETDKSSNHSWVFKRKTASKEKAISRKNNGENLPPAHGQTALPATFDVKEVSIRNGQLSYKNSRDNIRHSIKIEHFNAVSNGASNPMDFALIASVNGLPLDIAGNTGSLVQLSNNEKYHLNFKGEFGSADFMLTGRFERPLDLEGFSAKVDLGVDSLSQFKQLTNYPLPEYGPLRISADISKKGSALFVKDLRGTLADMNINATGKIKYPNKLKGMDFKLKVKANSLSDLSRVIKYNNFPRVGPLNLSARVTDGKNMIKFSGLDMKLDKSDLKGNVEIYLRKKKPYIAASLDSSLLDLSPFMPKKSSKNVIGGKVFSSSTLPFASLNKIDADLNINAYRIKTRRDNFDKVHLKLALKNGRLSSEKLKATLAGGSIDGKLNIDASRPGKTWVNGLINVYGLQPSRLSNLHNDISGAPTDMNIRVNGTGKSIAEIMGNMNGKIFVKVGKGTIKSDKFKILDSEIISNAVNTLLPLPPDKPGRELICAVMNLEIKDGQAATNKGIALSTERMDVVGSGLVNLKDETLNIGVKPRGKNGFGVGAGSLADLVRIVGPLSNPHIQPDGVAAFKKGLSVGAAVFTGGMSLIAQGIYGAFTIDNDPCGTAIKSTVKKAEVKTSSIDKAAPVKRSKINYSSSDRLLDMFN